MKSSEIYRRAAKRAFETNDAYNFLDIAYPGFRVKFMAAMQPCLFDSVDERALGLLFMAEFAESEGD